MADDQFFEIWDADFEEEAIQLAEAAVCSSSSNTTQPQPPQQLFPPFPPLHYAPPISYSPPRELSQRVKEDNHKNFSGKAFDCPVLLNAFSSVPEVPHSSRLHVEDKCSKQQEIDRLKEELGKVSKVLTNLEQECLELRKDREKNENHHRSAVNGSLDAEAFCSMKSNIKNKNPIEDSSVILQGTKGMIPCKAVGVQTDEHTISTDLTIKEKLSVSRKLADIWELRRDQQPRTNLVSKLFVACEADLQVLFGSLGLNILSKKTITKMDIDPKHCIQDFEAAKVSHLYLTLTKTSYDIRRLGDLLEALVDLLCLENTMIIHRSLCILHVVLKHVLSVENRLCSRDNVIVNDPSTSYRSSEKHSEMGNETSNPHHQLLKKLKGWNNDSLMDDSQPLISCSKWLSLFQTMHQVVMKYSEDSIRVESVSIMNILLLRTDAYAEREKYGEVSVFQNISQLLRKEVGIDVQKKTVHLLYLLLNCPNLLSMFCSSCKEKGITANNETASAFESASGAILDGLSDCLACRGKGAPTTLLLKLKRNAINLLAFLASSGRSGFEMFLGRNRPRRTNFLYLILQVLASEIDVEDSECNQLPDVFRERTLVFREALILVNRLVSRSQYSTPVLRILTKKRDTAILAFDIATRLSRKNKWRESEITNLARIFKNRVFPFFGEN